MDRKNFEYEAKMIADQVRRCNDAKDKLTILMNFCYLCRDSIGFNDKEKKNIVEAFTNNNPALVAQQAKQLPVDWLFAHRPEAPAKTVDLGAQWLQTKAVWDEVYSSSTGDYPSDGGSDENEDSDHNSAPFFKFDWDGDTLYSNALQPVDYKPHTESIGSMNHCHREKRSALTRQLLPLQSDLSPAGCWSSTGSVSIIS